MKQNSYYNSSPLREDFKKWFNSLSEYYVEKKEMKFYADGEPYFAVAGLEIPLRDFLERRELLKGIYNCVSIGGGGREEDKGLWQKKETDKTITFKYVDDLHFEPNYTEIKINKFYPKKKERDDSNYNAYRDIEEDGIKYRSWFNNGHVLRDWLDGTYTAYPNQGGTPYIFEPIKSENIEKTIKKLTKIKESKNETI